MVLGSRRKDFQGLREVQHLAVGQEDDILDYLDNGDDKRVEVKVRISFGNKGNLLDSSFVRESGELVTPLQAQGINLGTG